MIPIFFLRSFFFVLILFTFVGLIAVYFIVYNTLFQSFFYQFALRFLFSVRFFSRLLSLSAFCLILAVDSRRSAMDRRSHAAPTDYDVEAVLSLLLQSTSQWKNSSR
jgi:hypothetical protein